MADRQLLHHLFNCSYFSPGRNEQPILFYILNHRAEALVDPGGEFSRRCAEILKACGNTELDYQGLLSVLADSFAGMLSVFEITLRAGKRDVSPVLNLSDRPVGDMRCPSPHVQDSNPIFWACGSHGHSRGESGQASPRYCPSRQPIGVRESG